MQIKHITCVLNKKEPSPSSDMSLKFVNQFTYIGSNISSTESDDSIPLVQVGNATDKLSIMRKCDLSDKIKRDFFKVWWELHKNIVRFLDQILVAIRHKVAGV